MKIKHSIFRAYTAHTIGLILIVILSSILLGITCLSPIRRKITGVNEGVTYAGCSMEGLVKEEVIEIVADSSPKFYREPLSAYIDPVTKGLIVEMNGFELNIEKTAESILSAKPGTAAAPVLTEYLPDISRADFPLAVIYQGRPEVKSAALLINVAWGNDYIPEILETLAAANTKATFFLIGEWAEKNENVVETISSAGHQIETHGYSDAALPTEFSLNELQIGLKRSADWIEEKCGRRSLYYAPHAGDFNQDVITAARNEGMTTVLWSIDTVDWKKPKVDWMYNKVISNLHNGAMILMHPTADSKNLLKTLIPAIRDQGYILMTLDEMLAPGITEE